MPSAETLERFIALVEQNSNVEAIEAFYTENASMQENQSAPRIGRDNHVANERRVLSKAKRMTRGLDEFGARNGAAIAILLFALGLAGCATELSGRPGGAAAGDTPYVGVFTGEYLDGKPLYRFPPIYVVGSRNGV